MNSSLERTRKLRTGGTYAFFIIGSIVMIFPFVWMFLTSFKTVEESMMIPPTILPESWRLDSFKKALDSLPFLALYKNTFLLIFWRVVCAVAFSSMAGYAFAKLKFSGKKYPLFHRFDPDDAAFPDFYYSSVSDAGPLGLTNTVFALVFPGPGQRLRNFLPPSGLPGHPQRSGGGRLPGRLQPVADLYHDYGASDQGLHGSPGRIHCRFRLRRPDVASHRQHGFKHDDPFIRPRHSERTVQHGLPHSDGRLPPGHDSHGDPVSDFPETVHRGRCHDRRQIKTDFH